MSDMLALQILTGPLAMMLAGYAVAMIVLAFAIQPMRRRLIATVDDLLSEEKWSESDREQLFMLRDHSMSFFIGLLVPVATISVIADHLLNRNVHESDDQLLKDPRFGGCVWRFFASLAAANPIAAIFSVALMAVSLIISFALKPKSARGLVEETVEEPMLRALGRYRLVV